MRAGCGSLLLNWWARCYRTLSGLGGLGRWWCFWGLWRWFRWRWWCPWRCTMCAERNQQIRKEGSVSRHFDSCNESASYETSALPEGWRMWGSEEGRDSWRERSEALARTNRLSVANQSWCCVFLHRLLGLFEGRVESCKNREGEIIILISIRAGNYLFHAVQSALFFFFASGGETVWLISREADDRFWWPEH